MNPTATVDQKKNNQLLFIKNKLTADASGKLPTRIEILRAGVWENSWKGDLEILVSDLLEMKLNFAKGIGLPDSGSEGAPIDFSHNEWAEAAGWIKALEVDEANGILYASEIEWSDAGIAAIEGKRFKFFSPSVYPACLGSWSDPEDPTNTAKNVLMGGGLTNIPFFKGLTGLKASRSLQADGRENVIYLANEGETMELAVLRTKNKADLSTEELAFLGEHKAELTAEEQVATGVTEATPAEPATPAPTPAEAVVNNENPEVPAVSPEAVALQASISAGTHVVIAKDQLTSLQASADKSAQLLAAAEKEKIEGRVDAAIAAGKIKSDQKEKWVGRIVADATIIDDLEALPENKLLASELGDSAAEGSAKVQLESKIQAAREANPALSYGEATSQVRKNNVELAQAYDKEIKGEQERNLTHVTAKRR